MRLSVLQANHGDSIFISFIDRSDQKRNILIDGGPAPAYEYKNPKGKTVPGPLKKLLQELKDLNEVIDLLILTHVDHDHIGGLLKWFAKDPDAHRMIGSVWFNSGCLISEY